MPRFNGPYWLGSASPRRRRLLRESGVRAATEPPDLDDGQLRPGRVRPEAWVMAMAYLKARQVADRLRAEHTTICGTVIGADTVCVRDGAIIGQPRSLEHAREMLLAMQDRSHITMTGIALISFDTRARLLFFDRAQVTVGMIDRDALETYLASGQWRGKAGGYNLIERIDAGWPIRCEGDPDTVMGLPMRRLLPMLHCSSEPCTP